MEQSNTTILEPNPFAERLGLNALEAPALAAQGASPTEFKPAIPITADGIQLNSIEAVWRIAKLLYDARLAPGSFKTREQIAVALLRAIELKLPPLQAIEGMSVINNRVGLMGDLALSMVESSGLLAEKRVRFSGKDDSLVCTITITRKGREAQSYSFSVAEARAAGIYDRSQPWRAYPKRMTYYRALGFALRDEFSDVLKGIKTVEELMDYPQDARASERPPLNVQVTQQKES